MPEKISQGRGLHEYKKGQVSLTPAEREKLQKKGIDPDVVMLQATERIRSDIKNPDNSEDAAKEIIESIDMEKYMGFVKIAEFAPIKDREDIANQISDDIKNLSVYGNIAEVLPVLNKLNSIYKYLTNKEI
ncbi:MAG: hypothetical protein US57_C0008G0002 [Candidatus Moranbacteria bacterium GW2011_GWC2_37_73]|nr:MAG: hypothetical protein UR95_C0001G0109 [Parcubacteria group bacterium GW2011_GWC1_36_108]KKQ39818.1 MAG: hypothetical protein US57_C0008G0002 [Candidatus Moranbacteria bacterium GW2011_GWC2_37_73]HAS00034.1 hypothetical protein [Candidatus Moranbacteria bacterium]HBI50580.1 hypothetical protein [Candidatus Moranbacteria bacterium]HBU11105.1 hypothetical protein [Candidatus Moranbacteria bacterium]